MYYYKPDLESEYTDYNIYDPDKDYICSVDTEYQAKALISHLNRE